MSIIRISEEEAKNMEISDVKIPNEIDYSDIPKQKAEELSRYHRVSEFNEEWYRIQHKKISIHTKIDIDIIEQLKSLGKGYQTRLNSILRWAKDNECPYFRK